MVSNLKKRYKGKREGFSLHKKRKVATKNISFCVRKGSIFLDLLYCKWWWRKQGDVNEKSPVLRWGFGSAGTKWSRKEHNYAHAVWRHWTHCWAGLCSIRCVFFPFFSFSCWLWAILNMMRLVQCVLIYSFILIFRFWWEIMARISSQWRTPWSI